MGERLALRRGGIDLPMRWLKRLEIWVGFSTTAHVLNDHPIPDDVLNSTTNADKSFPGQVVIISGTASGLAFDFS